MQESSQNGTDSTGPAGQRHSQRDRNIFLRLYQQYVRPHLEFASPAWSPWQEGDKECLEKVQRRALGMIAGLKSRDYSERLKELGLTTLEERRHQLDMVQVYKIVNGVGGVSSEQWFKMAENVREPGERIQRTFGSKQPGWR
jgi:ribonuclease P/MRP protein subunit RPP40